jgi:hypothetical protein
MAHSGQYRSLLAAIERRVPERPCLTLGHGRSRRPRRTLTRNREDGVMPFFLCLQHSLRVHSWRFSPSLFPEMRSVFPLGTADECSSAWSGRKSAEVGHA